MNHFLSSLYLLFVIATLVGCTPEEQETFDINNISPTSGPITGNTQLVITGSNFSYIDGVSMDGSECSDMVVVSPSKITCTIPAHANGAVEVLVYGRLGRKASSVYTYTTATPTISSFTPSIGEPAGGTNLSIVGTGFMAGATVTIGGTACTSVVVSNSTRLSCTVPTMAEGAYSVVVTNIDGLTVTASTTYSYLVRPTVTSVSPSSGILAGGDTLTVTGTNFLAGAVITIGTTNCPTAVVVNSTTMTCVLPAKVTGTYNVLVTNTNNRTGGLTAGFHYKPMPTIVFAAPAIGIPAGGSSTTLYGTGFIASPLPTVTIGGSLCTGVVVTSSTVLTCTIAAKAPGTYNIVFTNNDTQSATKTNGFIYTPPPDIISVSPDAGALAGTSTLTITGTGFLVGMEVLVGVTPCLGSVLNSTTMTCSLPAKAAGTYAVTVTNTDTQTDTLAAAYTYQVAPTVTSLSLAGGALAGGTVVTVNGSNFLAGASVDFGGSDCATGVITATTISCTTTSHVAGTVEVTVTNSDGQTGTLAAAYTYRAAPTVVSVAASSGLQAGFTAVTITGTGFVALPLPTVTFGGVAATSVAVVNDTTITCLTPAHAGGAVTVEVTNSDLQPGSLAAAYTYTSIPVLAFVTGAVSPNPPNPDDYGLTTVAVTHTFTLTNTGEGPSSAITISVDDTVNYNIGTDLCTGFTLNVGADCTVQLIFRGDTATSGSVNPAILTATAVSGGTITNNVTGAVP